jgi:hypothetical protein
MAGLACVWDGGVDARCQLQPVQHLSHQSATGVAGGIRRQTSDERSDALRA